MIGSREGIVAVALACMLAACSSSPEESTPAEAQPAAQSAPTPAEAAAPPEGPAVDAATVKAALKETEGLTHGELLSAQYGKESPRLHLVRQEGLNPAGERLLERLEGAEAEGIDPEALGVPGVKAAAAEAGDEGARVTLELRLADAALAYAARFGPLPLSKDAEDPTPVRQRRFLSALVEAAPGGAEAVDAALDGLRPADPRYAALISGRARYAEIVEAGGWPTKMPYMKRPGGGEATVIRPGLKRYMGNVISPIKARLKGEGFYEGPVDETWEDAFSDAVRRYRKNNLLGDFAQIDYQMLQAMKVPAAWRLAQIDLNLDRLRRTRRGTSDYYVYVNVPRYRAALYDGGEQKLAFNVVTGSRKKYWDKEEEAYGFPDATPLLVEKMEKVVFSPTWMVPGRARVQLRRQAEGDPGFWKDNGYELLPGPNGGLIRQKPGPNNALGLVKFLFPNDDDIYMHDTNRKDLFREDVRAFSHGCIRVQDPLELARYVLSREDPSWDERKVSLAAKSGSTNPQALERGPDVFVEYVTVHPLEGGDVQFLWDIYHRDLAAIEARWGLEAPTSSHYP